jgi:hypothetical protein
MSQLTKVLMNECVEAFRGVRRSVWDAARLLYQVRDEHAATGQTEAFSVFVEDQCGISRGFASKLLSAYEHFVIKGDVSPEKLAGIDYEKAYMAIKLPGTPEKQLSQALTLSRAELRQEREEVGDHEHAWICRICGIKHP